MLIKIFGEKLKSSFGWSYKRTPILQTTLYPYDIIKHYPLSLQKTRKLYFLVLQTKNNSRKYSKSKWEPLD